MCWLLQCTNKECFLLLQIDGALHCFEQLVATSGSFDFCAEMSCRQNKGCFWWEDVSWGSQGEITLGEENQTTVYITFSEGWEMVQNCLDRTGPGSLFENGVAVTEVLSVSNLSLSSVVKSVEVKNWILLLHMNARPLFITISRLYLLPFPNESIYPSKSLISFFSPALLLHVSPMRPVSRMWLLES